MKNRIIIIGAGGHGKVVCEAILAQDKYQIIGFSDSNIKIGTPIIGDYKVIISQSNLFQLKNMADFFIIAIGNNKIRESVFSEVIQFLKPAIIIHPLAYIGMDVSIGLGSVVLSNAIICTSCKIGINAIVNSGVIIDHDNYIGDFVHLSIGTNIGSNSEINNFITTGIGENLNSFTNKGL